MRDVHRLKRIELPGAPFLERELAESISALIHYERGERDKALELLASLHGTLTRKHWPYHMCVVKLRLGEMHLKEGRLETARKHIRNALRLARGMDALSLLSHAHLLMGSLELSALEKVRLDSHASGRQEALDDGLAKAREALATSVSLVEQSGAAPILWRAHAELARVHEMLADNDACLLHARKAYDCLTSLEKRVPAEALETFRQAFGRSMALSALRDLIGRCERKKERSGDSLEEMEQEHLRILLRASSAINAIRDPDALLEEVVDMLIKALGMQRAMVFLRDASTGKLCLAKGRNVRHESLVNAERISQSVLEDVSRHERPFVSASAQADPRLSGRESVASFQLGTILCAPLKTSGATLGVLYADHPSAAGSMGESTINLFAAFSNLAAVAIDNALTHRHMAQERRELEEHLRHSREGYAEIIGTSVAMQTLRERIALVADSPLDVLIWGESGTGKELVARALHRTGRRAGGPFVAVDCGSLSDSLVESEFFGYRKGSFTGALENRAGLLEAGQGGVIFLDEVSNLSSKLQSKLLRVLQEREIRRIGEAVPRKIDVQVIAATNKNLHEEIRKGRFRRDLYYRLNAMEVRVPPLRERMEDMPLLLEWFLEKTAQLEGGRAKSFSEEAIELLKAYSFPGNVRELRNIIQSSYYSCPRRLIGIEHLPAEVREPDREKEMTELVELCAAHIYRKIRDQQGAFGDLVKGPFLDRRLDSATMRHIVQLALKDAGGNYRDAFRILRIPDREYSMMMSFIKRHGCYLDFRRFRHSVGGRGRGRQRGTMH